MAVQRFSSNCKHRVFLEFDVATSKLTYFRQGRFFSRMKQGFKMDTSNVSEIALAIDGTVVEFPLSVGGREVRCLLTRDALEQFFWLPPDANEARVRKVFADGRNRIFALAVRRAMRAKTDSLKLTASDFER